MTFDQGTAGTMRSSSFYGADMSIQVTDCFLVDTGTDAFNAVCVNVISG
jgi:hypothetical protein